MVDNAPSQIAWQMAKTPSLAELERLAAEIFRNLPKQFRIFAPTLSSRLTTFQPTR